MAPAYERRIILFVDFLGFKEVVEGTVGDPDALARLIAAMDLLGAIGEMADLDSQRLTQFSDCVVMSFRADEPSAVFWLLNAIGITLIQLVMAGYLVRGAVTVGDLYHSDRHVVGPAMVRAYEMESKVAVHPRVLIDPALLAIARRARSENNDPAEEEGHVRAFMATDDDGHHYFDYLSFDVVVIAIGAEGDAYPDYLGKIARMVRSGLAHADWRVADKYLWLRDRYVRQLPDDGSEASYDPDYDQAMRELPTFPKRTRAARRAVAVGRRTACNVN